MGFFSKLFNKNNFPIKKLEDTYQSFFNRYSPEIIDFMESKGYAYRDASGIHIDFNYISRATNILAEYALFLKILFRKKDMNWGKTAHGLVVEEQQKLGVEIKKEEKDLQEVK